tara:strand:+ start:1102 stop:1728 length:627 start_codon:yes stop_codon:yes gene_type:complete
MTINYNLIGKYIITFVISYSIFLVIQSLITQGDGIDKRSESFGSVDFIRIKQDDSLQERQRTIPDKPPTPKRPPTPKLEIDVSKPPPMANLDFDVPDFSLPTDFSGAFLGEMASAGLGTSQLIPIVKVAPRCPREAQMKGINGSVLMVLNVKDNGRVDKISIKQAKPAKMFESEAIKAVRRWQFKPKTIDGVAVDQKGELLVEFSCSV